MYTYFYYFLNIFKIIQAFVDRKKGLKNLKRTTYSFSSNKIIYITQSNCSMISLKLFFILLINLEHKLLILVDRNKNTEKFY